MKRFIKEYRELNPNHSMKIAKSAYTESKDLYNQSKVIADNKSNKEIILIPDPAPLVKVPVTATTDIIPLPLEMISEIDNKKQQEELERIEQENIQIVLNFWGNGLSRVINGEPSPQYPLHPESRRVVTPYDIYRCLDKINEETPQHTLLTIFASNDKIVDDMYRESQVNPLMASKKCVLFFTQKGHSFNREAGMWNDVILPKLRKEYITHAKDSAARKHQKTLDLKDDTIPNEVVKDRTILDSVISLYELLELLKKKPKILHSISDNELEYYHLNPKQIMSIRTICAINDTRIRNKQLQELFPLVYPPKKIIQKAQKTKIIQPVIIGGSKHKQKPNVRLFLF